MSLSSIIINDGLSDIKNNKNPYGLARRLIELIMQYRIYKQPYEETKAGFHEDHIDRLQQVFWAGMYNHIDLVDYYAYNEYYYRAALAGATVVGNFDMLQRYKDKFFSHKPDINSIVRDIIENSTLSYKDIFGEAQKILSKKLSSTSKKSTTNGGTIKERQKLKVKSQTVNND